MKSWKRSIGSARIPIRTTLVVASSGPNGNPLGWWVQGYGQRRSYTGIDVRALSFPDEREQAEIANEIFAPSTGAAAAHSLIRENGIDFLVVDRRGADASWLGGNVATTFERLYESPAVAILMADPVLVGPRYSGVRTKISSDAVRRPRRLLAARDFCRGRTRRHRGHNRQFGRVLAAEGESGSVG